MAAELKTDGTLELTIEREFAYPPKRIFDAWIIPDKFALWMGHSDEMQARNVVIDAVKGGSFSMEFDGENGATMLLSGVYHRIERYTHLVFTWVWEPPMDAANPETLVSVEFIPTESGTRLRLVHQRFGSEEMRDCHAWGWEGTFDKLLRRLDQVLGA